MNKHSLFISPMQAREIAFEEAGISGAKFIYQKLDYENGHGLYRLEYLTDYMEYCCYIDAEEGTVKGFDYRPRAV